MRKEDAEDMLRSSVPIKELADKILELAYEAPTPEDAATEMLEWIAEQLTDED